MIPEGKQLISGNQAAAYGVLLSRPDLVAAYPITPQTALIEHIAAVAAKEGKPRFTNMESEHSALAYAIAGSRAGCRVFSATSSQGLYYMHEELQRASRERVPVVLVNVNRGTAMPWTIHPDLNDSMSQRDTGWIQLYCETGQELLDTIICAFRIAESVSLPVMVCEEGFFISHTSEIIDVPKPSLVDSFLSAYVPRWKIDPDEPHVFGAMAEPEMYFEIQKQLHGDLLRSSETIDEVTRAFSEAFGRFHPSTIELVNWHDPKIVLVTIGSVTGSAREFVERFPDVGLLRVHAFRPFPSKLLRDTLCGVKKVMVVDRALSYGFGGTMAGEVRAALSLLDDPPKVFSFVGGFGGVDITPKTLVWAFGITHHHEKPDSETIYLPGGA